MKGAAKPHMYLLVSSLPILDSIAYEWHHVRSINASLNYYMYQYLLVAIAQSKPKKSPTDTDITKQQHQDLT